jgi:hypothetical protein
MKQAKPVKNQTQREAFIAMAKELGEATETAFNKVLKRVGKATVPAKNKKVTSKKGS